MSTDSGLRTAPVGITSFGTYLPAYSLERADIASALGVAAGQGSRRVAGYDEDSTSMGVAAARRALSAVPAPEVLLFASCTPAYLDKTNATAVHAALGLPQEVGAYDMLGSVRSASGALRAAIDAARGGRSALAVLADIRSGLPGSGDESQGGDGAAALLFGDVDVLAEVVATASTSAEFLDRWRVPGDTWSSTWEDRFGEGAYLPLAEAAVADALKQADLTVDGIDRLVVVGLHHRAVRQLPKALGVSPDRVLDNYSGSVGSTGCAQPGLMLACALEAADPGDVILLVSLADGADAMVFRALPALAAHRNRATTLSAQLGSEIRVSYPTFLTWRGNLRRDPPRRPDPDRPAAPPSFRSEAWKFGFVGSRCQQCETRHVPPARVCVACHAVDQMSQDRLADIPGTIATFTVDRLAFSMSPPVVVAVVDFDGGGRFQCEMTDVDPARVAIGDRVEMTFRRLYTADGVPNYFWKARPLRALNGMEG